MNENKTCFDVEKMKKFAKQDRMINFMIEDLKSKGHEEEYALRITYNTLVLEDSQMERAYEEV